MKPLRAGEVEHPAVHPVAVDTLTEIVDGAEQPLLLARLQDRIDGRIAHVLDRP